MKLESSDQFTAIDGDSLSGNIDPNYTHLTDALLEESAIELQITCIHDPAQQGYGGRQKSSKLLVQSLPCSLAITLYGPMELFENIGDFFQSYEIYLQDPRQCDRNVRYCNPHRLSSSDPESCLWTSDLLENSTQLVEMATLEPRPELLDMLESYEELPETPQPASIGTILAKYCTAT